MSVRSLAKLYSAELEGIRAKVIEVEVDINVGLHTFNIVGLADKALNEARERVNSALKNCGAKPPNRENRKIVVNLAPADVKKTGSQYDLAIAIGYLKATQQIAPFEGGDKVIIGELALDGSLRPVAGALNIAEAARDAGFTFLLLPARNAHEAAVIDGITVVPLTSLREAIEFLEGKRGIELVAAPHHADDCAPVPDFSDIKGQAHAKRALTVAAAGAHNLLMVGPPGVGKSYLAQAMVGILPGLTPQEAIEVTKIYSAAGLHAGGLMKKRPFRSPHQSASAVSIVGGGSDPRPGEASLAHRGVLFLDEFPEFQRNILESLRQPLESGEVRIARARGTMTFPARCTLVAAMNPCPCGYFGDEEKECRCAPYEVLRYQKRISGPLLDRIDLQVRVPRVTIARLREQGRDTPESPPLKTLVEEARSRQAHRFKTAGLPIMTNAEMGSPQVERFVKLSPDAEALLKSMERSHVSPRGYYRTLKTAQTIADIEKSSAVNAQHLAEAFGYRVREEARA